MRVFLVAAVLGVAAMRMACAALLPDGGVTAQDVARVLQAKGFQAEITTDKQGDPLVRSNSGGAKFAVYFYECGGKARCTSIQFSAGFSGTGLTPDKVADWNRTKRFGRVYLDKDRDPWIEMDVDLERGATTEAIVNELERRTSVMGSFMRYIGR